MADHCKSSLPSLDPAGESRHRGALPAAILKLPELPEDCVDLLMEKQTVQRRALREAAASEKSRTVPHTDRVPSRRNAWQYRLKIPNEGRQDPNPVGGMFEDVDTTHWGSSIVILVGYQGQDTASREPSGPLVLSSVSIPVWVAWSEDGTSRLSERVGRAEDERGRVLVSLGNGLPRQAGWENGGGQAI